MDSLTWPSKSRETSSNLHVRIRDVALRTSQRQRTIGRSGERWTGISVLVARQDDIDASYHGQMYFNLLLVYLSDYRVYFETFNSKNTISITINFMFPSFLIAQENHYLFMYLYVCLEHRSIKSEKTASI